MGKGGVVREAERMNVCSGNFGTGRPTGAGLVAGLTVSPAPGPAGNVEFLIWLRRNAGQSIDIDSAISSALELAKHLGKKS